MVVSFLFWQSILFVVALSWYDVVIGSCLLALLFFFFFFSFQSPSSQDWSSMTASSIASVDPSCFGPLSDVDFARIPSTACAGLTSNQLSQLATQEPFVTCEGFSAACLAAIKDVSSLSSLCLRRIDPDSCVAFSATQLNSLTAKAYVRPSCMAKLTSSTCAALSSSFLAVLDSINPIILLGSQCASLSAACVSALNPVSLGAVSKTCFTSLQTNVACGAMTPAQVSQLPQPLSVLFTASCVGKMQNATCGALPWTSIDPNLCSSVTPGCILASSLLNVPPSCSLKFSGSVCSTALGANNVASITALSSSCIALLNNNACSAVTTTFVQNLGNAECQALTSACLKSFSHLSSVPYECGAALSTQKLIDLGVEKLTLLSAGAVASISGSNWATLVRSFGNSLVSAFTDDRMPVAGENVAADFIRIISTDSTFPSPQFSFANVSFGAGASWLQLAWSTNGASLVSQAFESIPPVAMEGLRPSDIALLPSTLWGSLPPLHQRHLSCHLIRALSVSSFSMLHLSDICWPLVRAAAHFEAQPITQWISVWKSAMFLVNATQYPCNSILEMPSAYFSALSSLIDPAVEAVYLQWRSTKTCPSQDKSVVPCSAWKFPLRMSDPVHLTSSSSSTTGTVVVTTAPPDLPWWQTHLGVVIGVTVSVVVVIGALVVFIVVKIVRKRRLASIQYTPLNTISGLDIGSDW